LHYVESSWMMDPSSNCLILHLPPKKSGDIKKLLRSARNSKGIKMNFPALEVAFSRCRPSLMYNLIQIITNICRRLTLRTKQMCCNETNIITRFLLCFKAQTKHHFAVFLCTDGVIFCLFSKEFEKLGG